MIVAYRKIMLPLFLLILCGAFFSVYAFSAEQVREYFEWGEYSKLIDELEPFLNRSSDIDDSAETAQYYCYLGVAHFGLGEIGEARKLFYRALCYNIEAALDSRYVTDEMINLFMVTKSEYINQKRELLFQDSILNSKQIAYESDLSSVKLEALQRRVRNNSILAVSFAGIGAVFLGIVAFEYYSSRESYNEFKIAASSGDRVSYDRFRPVVKRANIIILGGEIAAGASLISGAYFSIKLGKMKRKLKHQ